MFDLYGLNGEKKLSNIGQCGRVDCNVISGVEIIDKNLIGAKFIIVDFVFIDSFYATISSLGNTSVMFALSNTFYLFFNSRTGSVRIDTTVSDKTQVKMNGYFYIK